jgi:hypothetical protein
MTQIKFIWKNEGTHEGITEWTVETSDGLCVADVNKERGARWGQGCRGMVRDQDSPWEWDVTIWKDSLTHFQYTVPNGATFREVKALTESKWAESA